MILECGAKKSVALEMGFNMILYIYSYHLKTDIEWLEAFGRKFLGHCPRVLRLHCSSSPRAIYILSIF